MALSVRGSVKDGVEYAIAHNCALTMSRAFAALRYTVGLDYADSMRVVTKLGPIEQGRVEEMLLEASAESEL